MRKSKLVINNCDNKVTNIIKKVYNFIITKYPVIKEKIIFIDFLTRVQIKRLKNSIWKQNLYTDTITLIYDDSVQIYLCLDVIQDNSKINNFPFEKELVLVLIHSFLHSMNLDDKNAEDLQFFLLKEYYGEKI